MKYIRFIICLLFIANYTFAQKLDIPIATWRTHLAYGKAFQVEETSNRVYASVANSILYYDKTTEELNAFTKMDGLNGVGVSYMKYDNLSKTLVIGYQDGNIDFVVGEQIHNLSDIIRTNIVGSKRINHILFYKGLAYLSCDFGIVVLNIAKREVKESNVLLGNGGASQIGISSMAIINDTLYANTSQGLKYIPLNRNLLNTSLWKNISNQPSSNITTLAVANNVLYAGLANGAIVTINANNWTNTNWNKTSSIRYLEVQNTDMLVAYGSQLDKISLNTGANIEVLANGDNNPLDAQLDAVGNVWVADGSKGLLRVSGTRIDSFVINGPYEDLAQRFYTYDNKIVALAGGYDNSIEAPLYRESGYFVFENNTWSSYGIAPKTPNMPYAADLINAVYNEGDQTLYIASFNYGILTLKNGVYGLINHQTPGSKFEEITSAYRSLRIADIKTDSKNNLWATSFLQDSPKPAIHVRRAATGQWQSYFLNIANGVEQFLMDFVVADNDDKWIRVSPRKQQGSIVVFNDTKNTYRMLSTTSGNGGLPSTRVNCVTKDLEGEIWVGTDIGVAVFDNPSAVLASPNANVNARLPIIDGRPLLEADVVTAIAVDGGNRKWIGTKRNGVWLFDADGEKVISHFTKQNSPLLSDNVIAIVIQNSTGEVFFSTENGIVSYRGSATLGDIKHENVKIFPNPVKPDFDGLVGISGLANNAKIKITDVSGKLMYETTAQGGQATWNRKNYTGREAESGIYLVFSADETGQDTFVGKIAVVK